MEGSDPDADTSRNLDQAKELLQGTECASGCTIEMMQRAGYPPYDTISTIVAANLKDVGINAEIKTVDQATANANEASGNFEMEVGGLYDVVNSPELIMLTYGLVPAGGINALFSYYENDELTKLYEQLIETEGDARTPLLDGINAIFAADMPYVPFGDFTTLWASRVSTRVVAFTSSGSFQIGTEESAPGQ
jgi:ABC-type transport system substrate-binding protein